jgi:hypothetical protein
VGLLLPGETQRNDEKRVVTYEQWLELKDE